MRRAACLLVVVAALGVGLTYGQPETTKAVPKSAAPSSEKAKRFLYLVRYGAAKDLATTLSQHFNGEQGVQLVPEVSANALLITAPESVSAEMIKLLDALDRRPRQVVIDVLIAECPIEEGKESPFDAKDLSGPADTVLPKVEALAKKAKVNHLRRFQISALENQRSMVQLGGSQPMVTGVNARAFGGGAPGNAVTQNITYRDVGTLLSAIPRIGSDDVVTVELKLDESRLHTPENGIVIGGGATASETIQTTLSSKVNVGNGKAVLVEGVKTESKSAKVQAIVVLAARVVEK